MQEVEDHDGLEDVELEVALGAGEPDRRVVADHLRAHHRHRFALRGVDLARHDRRAGLVLGEDELTQPRARA